MKIDNSPARGMRDLLPATTAVRDRVLARITEVYRRFGYQRIETPALEDITRLQGGQGGENEKLIFRVLRRGLDEQVTAGTSLSELIDLGLRFDLTVPLTRFYGQHLASLPLPFRSFQFGPVWRAERPQKGRYRQFYQCDIDLVGEASVLAEIELIEATTEAIAAIGLPGTAVRLSDRRFLSALADGAGVPQEAHNGLFITLDKLDKIGWDGVCRELESRGLDEERIEHIRQTIESLRGIDSTKIVDQLSDSVPNLGEEVITDLDTTIGGLRRLAEAREPNWEFDPTLVRGMGYYTGQIFEVGHPSTTSSLAGGGRYDRLIGRSLGKDVPACGFSIGFERIVDLLGGAERAESVALLYENDVVPADVLAAARGLREQGHTVSAIRRSGKFGAQLGRLETWGFTALVHLKADTAELPEPRRLGEDQRGIATSS